MGLTAFREGANVIALEKNNRKYGMTCAWSMMVAFDKVLLLIGKQSVTGKIIKKGDFIGVSALAEGQESIAKHYGKKHSDVYDKFDNNYFYQDGSAILIHGATRQMVVVVKDILNLEDCQNDVLVYGLIISTKEVNIPFADFDLIYYDKKIGE